MTDSALIEVLGTAVVVLAVGLLVVGLQDRRSGERRARARVTVDR